MNNDNDQNKEKEQQNSTAPQNSDKKPHSSAFNERDPHDLKIQMNTEEDASLEQMRKDAITERD